MRHDDPLGDYGRQKRQRQVIQAIAKKALNFSNVSKFDDILKAVKGNMQTDLSYDDMWAIETNYKKAASNIKSQRQRNERAFQKTFVKNSEWKNRPKRLPTIQALPNRPSQAPRQLDNNRHMMEAVKNHASNRKTG